MTVEFVKYTGKYPNLCRGVLFLKIDGETLVLSRGCLTSTGSCDWRSDITIEGEWFVNVPEKYDEYSDEIHRVVNANVPHGCCGGCI